MSTLEIDYDETMTIDGETIDFATEEQEVTMYVVRCIYNGREVASEPHETKSEALHDLRVSVQYYRKVQREAEREKLARWNAGEPLKVAR